MRGRPGAPAGGGPGGWLLPCCPGSFSGDAHASRPLPGFRGSGAAGSNGAARPAVIEQHARLVVRRRCGKVAAELRELEAVVMELGFELLRIELTMGERRHPSLAAVHGRELHRNEQDLPDLVVVEPLGVPDDL